MLTIKIDMREWQDLLPALLMALVSMTVAVFWGRLFYQPNSRITDWLSLLILYGVVSAALQALLPNVGKGQLLIPALLMTVSGAAWAWRYVNVLAGERFIKRLGVMCAGVLFVFGVPLIGWTAMMILYLVDSPFRGRLLWVLVGSALAVIPGLLVQSRAQQILNEQPEHSG